MYSSVAFGRSMMIRCTRIHHWKCRFHTSTLHHRLGHVQGIIQGNEEKDARYRKGMISIKQVFSGDVKNVQRSPKWDSRPKEQRIRKHVREGLEQCHSGEQVLSQIEVWSDLSAAELVLILNTMVKFCTEESCDNKTSDGLQYIEDKRFERIETLLEKKGSKAFSPDMMVGARSCLLKLKGFKSPIVRQLQKPIKDSLPTLPFSLLFRVVTEEEKLQSDLYRKGLKRMQIRWAEIKQPEQLIFLMERGDASSLALRTNLQELALVKTGDMNMSERLQILRILSTTGQRNLPLIKNLAHFFNTGVERLQINKLGHILYFLSNLNVYDEALMKNVSQRIIDCLQPPRTHAVDTKILASILFSMKEFRYRDINLIETILDLIFTKPSDLGEDEFMATLDPEHIASVILSCVSLGYIPTDWGEGHIIQKCVENIHEHPKIVTKATKWLDTVWALTILKMADSTVLKSVLDTTFYTKLMAGKDNSYFLSSYLKLRDVHLSAKYEVNGYTEPLLPMSFINKYNTQVKTKTQRPLLDSIVKELIGYLGETNVYFETDYRHPEGIVIDIEMVVNEKGEPQPKVNYSVDQRLPETFHRIAIKPIDFGETMRCNPGLSGIQQMQQRQLRFLGYNVVQIPYSEWNGLKTSVEKVKYLNTKIKESFS